MEEESELKVKRELLDALKMRPFDGMEAAPELVLAAALHGLAVRRGLAQRDDPDHGVLRNAGLPGPAMKVLSTVFGSDGEIASDDDVRNGLYSALVELVETPHALRDMDRTKPFSAGQLLMFAQIFWNLDAEDPRTKLPIRIGQMRQDGTKAYIKVYGSDEDFAKLDLARRADLTPGYAKAGGAYYKRAARLIAFLAKLLLVDRETLPVEGAALRSTQTRRGAEWVIIWPSKPKPTREAALRRHEERVPAKVVDSTVDTLRHLRQTNVNKGNLELASLFCSNLVDTLRKRSEENPGDHESELAEEYLLAGATFAVAVRFDEALEYVVNARDISQTLLDLEPDLPLNRLRLAISRALSGFLLTQVGRIDGAEVELTDAIALSQTLADEDAEFEDALATSLAMLGAVFLQTDRMQEALPVLSRSVTISQKIVRRNPDSAASQLQLAIALGALGMCHLQAGELMSAEDFLMRSVGLLENIAMSGLEERSTRLLFANNNLLLGFIFSSEDRYDQARDSIVAAILQAKAIDKRHSDELSGSLVMNAHYMLALIYVETGCIEEAVIALNDTVAASRSLMSTIGRSSVYSPVNVQASIILGGALSLLGLIYTEQERHDDAEAALIEAIEIIGGRSWEGANKTEVFDLLVNLYRRQGREADAEHILELGRRFGDQSPGSPISI